MTTSGSYQLIWDRNTILTEALALLGVASSFRNPSPSEYNIVSQTLNMYIKHLQKKGLRPPQQTQIVVFLKTTAMSENANTYTLGPNGDHASYTYNQTATITGAIIGATNITVESTTGFAAGYSIGILLDDGTMQWTTESGAPAGNVITLAAPLIGDVTTGNTVFVYPSKIQKPLRFNNCQRALADGTEAIVGIENRSDYFNISNKTIQGYPTQLHYSPKINDGQLYIFPISSQSNIVLKATVEYPLEVFTNSVQTPPFPDEWALTLCYGTAALAAPKFGFNGKEYDDLVKMAAGLEQDILATDVEDNFIQFLPDTNGDYAY